MGRRLLVAMAAATLLTGLLVGAPTPQLATAAPAQRLEVSAPRDGALILTRSKAAAKRTTIKASVRVAGPVSRLTVDLNGHQVPVAVRAGDQQVRLDRSRGLQLGENLLWVTATYPGSKRPLAGSVRFLVGYRVSGLLRTTVRTGNGSRPAAVARLRAPLTGVHALTARLNGHDIAVPQALPDGTKYRHLQLDLAQTGRLRFGRNVLKTRLVRADGRVQSQSRTFNVSRARAIARIAVTGPTTLGHQVRLDARASRLPTGAVLTAGWTLLRRPMLSRLQLGTSTAPDLAFTPDVVGRYRVAVDVGRGRRTGRDVLDVEVTYPQGVIPFTTIDYSTDSSYAGMQIADTHLKASPGHPIQLFVLDRSTLELTDQQGFDATTAGYSSLQSVIAGRPASSLVVVTHASKSGPVPADSTSSGLATALAQIGGALGSQWAFQNNACWSGGTNYCMEDSAKWARSTTYTAAFTVAGILGMPAGQGWRATGVQSGTAEGALQGFLTLGVANTTGVASQYSIVSGPDPYVDVDTCVASCAAQVGDQTYPVPSSGDGMHVVVLDRTTLKVLSNTLVTTWSQLGTTLNPTTVPTVGHFLIPPLMDDQRLFVIQSIGTGELSGSATSQTLEQLDQIGVTYEAFAPVAQTGGKYAVVGAADNLPWHSTTALESSSAQAVSQANGQPKGSLSGVLQRGRTQLYGPLEGNPSGPSNRALYSILYQDPVAWPYADETDALKYIADNIGLSNYEDVRSAYTNQNLSFSALESQLLALQCSGQTFCGSEYDQLQTQLAHEFTWVSDVENFIHAMQAPYQSSTSGYFSVAQVTSQIVASIPQASNNEADMKWLTIMTGVAGIAAKATPVIGPEGAAVFGTISAAGSLASSLMETPTGGSANTVTKAAGQLAGQLAQQQQAYLTWTNHLQVILLSDYGKLSTIGKDFGSSPGWDWTGDDTNAAIDALNAGATAAAYSAVLPTYWYGYNLKPGNDQMSQGSDDVTTFVCDEPANYPEHHTPFSSSPPENQFHATTGFTSSGTRVSQVWVLTEQLHSWGTFNDAYVVVAPTPLTDSIYGKHSTAVDPATGLLPAFQYQATWWRDTFDPPGHVTCQSGNGGLDVNQVWSQNYPAPVITPPLP
jgi:type II secretory pathway pseudopilin PulG